MSCQSLPYCPDGPLMGYDSNQPDVVQFIGVGFGPNTPPPLGSAFVNPTCMSTAQSAISQGNAEDRAFLNAVVCAESTWQLSQGAGTVDGQSDDISGGGLNQFPVNILIGGDENYIKDENNNFIQGA